MIVGTAAGIVEGVIVGVTIVGTAEGIGQDPRIDAANLDPDLHLQPRQKVEAIEIALEGTELRSTQVAAVALGNENRNGICDRILRSLNQPDRSLPHYRVCTGF